MDDRGENAAVLGDRRGTAVASRLRGASSWTGGARADGSTPSTLINAIARRGVDAVSGLTLVSNNAGVEEKGLGAIIKTGQVKKCIVSHIGATKLLENKYLAGEIEIELTPQGTIAERVRAAGAGIPAFFTPTGVETSIEKATVPYRNASKDGSKPALYPTPRKTMEFNGKKYVMEEALPGDVAIIHAWKIDEAGNAIFRYTATNFSPTMAKGAKCTIVEVSVIWHRPRLGGVS